MSPDELATLGKGSENTAASIASRAGAMGMTFPNDFSEFLESCDGVSFEGGEARYTLTGTPSALDSLCSLEKLETYYEGAAHDVEDPSYRYKFRHCIIGTVNAEELVLVTEPGEFFGKVFFWDNEEGCLMEDPEDYADELDGVDAAGQISHLIEEEVISEVAPSFTGLIARIVCEKS